MCAGRRPRSACSTQPSHRAARACRSARESIVLLKNDRAVAAASEGPRHARRDRPERRSVAHAARQLQRHPGRPDHAAARHSRGGAQTHARALRARLRSRRRVSRARLVPPVGDVDAPAVSRASTSSTSATTRSHGAPLFTARRHRRSTSNWHDGAPRADMNADDFGVRWTGDIRPPHDGHVPARPRSAP